MQLIELAHNRVSRTAAFKRFGSFKKEEEHAIRQLDVNGDELHWLRQRRGALLSMTPEQAMNAIEFHKGLNVFEALALAKREGKIIVPHFVHDRILTETDDWDFINKNYPVYSGTLVVYEKPGKPFGENTAYSWRLNHTTWATTFAIPAQFRGRKNCALVIEHPDFDFVSVGNNRFELRADEKSITLLEDFPGKSGKLYRPDGKFRIPVGAPNPFIHPQRCLLRAESNYIGPVARGYGDRWSSENDLKYFVGLNAKPSVGIPVAVF